MTLCSLRLGESSSKKKKQATAPENNMKVRTLTQKSAVGALLNEWHTTCTFIPVCHSCPQKWQYIVINIASDDRQERFVVLCSTCIFSLLRGLKYK